MKSAILMDAHMSALEALERMALNGYWLDAGHPVARQRLEALATNSPRSVLELATLLARPAAHCGVAVRRQWGANILWYPRELAEVLARCVKVPPDTSLLDALELNESDSKPVIDLAAGMPIGTGVVMLGGEPIGVSFATGPEIPIAAPVIPDDLSTREADKTMSASLPLELKAWPRIIAPQQVAAGKPFDAIVGFSAQQVAGVSGAELKLPVKPGQTSIRVTIELCAAQGLEAPGGWSRTIDVPVADPQSAEARFTLVGTEPTNSERLWLTMLEVRYVVDGIVCGLAAKPLIVLPGGPEVSPPLLPFGVRWTDVPEAASPIELPADPNPPDLTMEISEPSGNPAVGQYVCRLYSPHALAAARGPFEIRLGQDSATFARQIVDDVRANAGFPTLDLCLEGIGRLIAGRLPAPFFQALDEVSQKMEAHAQPSVLIVSREPYVPWELAWVAKPIDATRPSYLGAQALVGRWLRSGDAAGHPASDAAAPRPSLHPKSTLDVKHLAVMSAFYKAGLKRLPKAELEASALAQTHPVVQLRATPKEMANVLMAKLYDDNKFIGPVDVFHFAGHGNFDPNAPDGSALFLEGGPALRSNMFGSARYGGEHQPFLFLNACMLGIGGDVLGDMGGFPGSSLRGGFGAVLSALWEIDDDVAHDIALEFWRRVLPPAPARGEPVGSVLRDLRAKYAQDGEAAPVSTYLSYVYYGHPRLTMTRMT